MLACILWVSGSGCRPLASNCTTDRDCESGERCVGGGGLVVATGGRCIAETVFAPAADSTAGADTDADGIPDTRTGKRDVDASPDAPTSDTSWPDADGDCPADAADSCTCDYRGRAAGICADRPVDSNGNCPPPADFEAPTPAERHCDDRDNDCDGDVDEGCDCTDGETAPCYTGPGGTAGTGICSTGTKTCESGAWGACEDEQPPESEKCGDQRDSDCDGDPHNGCDCDYRGKSEGVCGDALEDAAGRCGRPDHYQETETDCDDGRDNDCDGKVDYEHRRCKKAPSAICHDNEECLGGHCYRTAPITNGHCGYRIFVTSGTNDGDLGGQSGADAKCQQAASSANLGGTWKAILSHDTIDANAEIEMKSALYNLRGDRVATSASQLWSGTLQNSVAVDETGSDHHTPVWTGSSPDGTNTSKDCRNWTSSAANATGTRGDSTQSDGDWLDVGKGTCERSAALYCVDGQ